MNQSKEELPEPIETFQQIDTDILLNADFGTKNFAVIKPQFDEFYKWISEMIGIAFGTDGIPEGIKKQVSAIASEFNNFFTQIKSYSIEKDGQNQFSQHKLIIRTFRDWYEANYTGTDHKNRPRNFFTTYNTCKNFSGQNLEQEQNKMNELLASAEQDKGDIETILGELRKKSADETVVDYADIFKSQAEKHSSFRIVLSPWKQRTFKIGTSQLWFVLALILGCGLVFAIKHLTDIFPLNSEDDFEIRIIRLLTRFVFISFLIYLITFCFRQYSINKHLFTLNKHRQNTLNSYKLFLETVDREDSTTRNALMLEVAKSIYEAGVTGYISSKQQENSQSIIEMTRLIKDSN